MEVRMRVVFALLVFLIAAGCLESEETDIRILRAGGEPAVFVMEQVNFYSDQTDAGKIQEDFNQLLRDLRSDDSPGQSADGFRIKNRELLIRDGKIVLRQTGIMEKLNTSDGEIRVSDSQIIWTWDGTAEITQTNGKILDTNPRTVIWPKDAPEL